MHLNIYGVNRLWVAVLQPDFKHVYLEVPISINIKGLLQFLVSIFRILALL